MIGATFVPDWTLIGVVLFALFMFGLAYNALVSYLGTRKDGYTALLVACGVLVTLAGVALIAWQAAALTLAAFVASGIPMIIGDIYRAVKRRETTLEDIRKQALEQTNHE